MAFVEEVANSELRKDVVAIRNPEQADEVHARVAALLRKPLTADTAVQIALLNNRGLQAAYNALGIAEAEMVAAHLPPSRRCRSSDCPIRWSWKSSGASSEISWRSRPCRRARRSRPTVSSRRNCGRRRKPCGSRRRRGAPIYTAVAARQTAAFLDQAKSAAETATKLAKRLGETGAMNKIDQSREYVFYAEVTGQLGTARQRMSSEREKLIRALGLGATISNSRCRRSCRTCRAGR